MGITSRGIEGGWGGSFLTNTIPVGNFPWVRTTTNLRIHTQRLALAAARSVSHPLCVSAKLKQQEPSNIASRQCSQYIQGKVPGENNGMIPRRIPHGHSSAKSCMLWKHQGGDRKSFTLFMVHFSPGINQRFHILFGPICARAVGGGGSNLTSGGRSTENTVFPTVQDFS